MPFVGFVLDLCFLLGVYASVIVYVMFFAHTENQFPSGKILKLI